MRQLEEANRVLLEPKKNKVSISAINTCTKRLYEHTEELQRKSDSPDDFNMILFWLKQISNHIENNT